MPSPFFPRRQIGQTTVTAVSDGFLGADLGLLSNITPDDAQRLQSAAGQTDTAAIHINCYVLQRGGRTLLIDAGMGGLRNWGGRLAANLADLGVLPDQIDTILLTHAHPDHIGGLLDRDGKAVFPQAELLIHHSELTFWQDDAMQSRAAPRAQGNFAIARQTFQHYRSQLRPFSDGPDPLRDLLPGLHPLPIPGHTAGHCGYLIEEENQSLLIWGDVVHFPHIQITRPDVAIAFDQDQQQAARQRIRLLDQVSTENTLIAGMHLGEQGFARIQRRAGSKNQQDYELHYEE